MHDYPWKYKNSDVCLTTIKKEDENSEDENEDKKENNKEIKVEEKEDDKLKYYEIYSGYEDYSDKFINIVKAKSFIEAKNIISSYEKENELIFSDIYKTVEYNKEIKIVSRITCVI